MIASDDVIRLQQTSPMWATAATHDVKGRIQGRDTRRGWPIQTLPWAALLKASWAGGRQRQAWLAAGRAGGRQRQNRGLHSGRLARPAELTVRLSTICVPANSMPYRAVCAPAVSLSSLSELPPGAPAVAPSELPPALTLERQLESQA